MWKFIVDVHDYGSSLRPDVGRGFLHVSNVFLLELSQNIGVGGAVRFLVVGTIGQEERPPRGQLWMEQCLTLLKYWPI